MPHVLIAGRIDEAGIARLDARRDLTYELLASPSEADMLAGVVEADGLLLRTARLTRAMIERAPRLRIVSRHGVGYDNVDLAACNERRIALAVAGTANMISVAEHALFMMLALAKHGVPHDRAVREGRWSLRDGVHGFDLFGKTLLLVGFGRVGREVTRRALAFGMAVLVLDPFVDAVAAEAAGARKVEDLHQALPLADVVSVHAPRTAETEGLLGRDAFARMKQTAIVVNTARGGIVDEDALAEALRAGRIRAAGLDVFDAEPPADGHPLLRLDNVLLSPHCAGVTAESMVRMAVVAADNVVAGLDGRLDPTMVVNREVLGG